MEEFIKVITNVGFPIAVSAYLLIRFEKKLESLEKAIVGQDGLVNAIKGKDGLVDRMEDMSAAVRECAEVHK